MISQTAEYALRAVVFLTETGNHGVTTEQISKATQIPAAYLSKVLQQLSRAGIVQSQRGLGGGFTLSKPPAKLTALNVINAVEPIKRIKVCPLGLDAHATKLCALHQRLDEAAASIEKAFANTSIVELMADPQSTNVYTFPPKPDESAAATKKNQPSSSTRRRRQP